MRKILVLATVFLMVMLFLSGCNIPWSLENGDSEGGQPNNGNGEEDNKTEVSLYFPSKDNSRIVGEKER